MYIFIFLEVGMGLINFTSPHRYYEVLAYFTEKNDAPHSVFFMPALDAPYSSWTHRKNYIYDDGTIGNRTIVYGADKNPTYARRRQGVPIQILHDEEYNECYSLTQRLERQVFRPQYVVIDEWTYNDSLYAFEACMHTFNKL
jgi:hypothetical protein